MDKLPWELTLNNCGEFIDLLAADADWKSRVFGIASVNKFSCNSFFLQLFATGILSFEWKDGKVVIVRSLNEHSDISQYCFEEKLRWEGITFRTSATRHSRRNVTFREMLTGNSHWGPMPVH